MSKVARPRVVAAALAATAAAWWLMGGSTSIVRAQSDPSLIGAWSAVQTWPIVSVHASLLPTGKVIFYSFSDDARLWDPSTGSIVAAAPVGYNIFCTGLTLLADGKLFLAGGHIANNVGLNYASIYDPQANTWARQADMNAGRWYPTATTLADGSVLVISGDVDITVGVNRLPQVWTNGTWRDLSTAQASLPLYPFMFLAPDGRVFNAGPEIYTRYLNTSGTGAWTTFTTSTGGYRSYGTAVMYEPGKVLMVGGNDPPTASAEKIDLNLAVPTWQSAGLMHTARRQLNGTILPDGTVLITGGSSGAGFDNAATPVFTAERWDPAQNSFTELASATRYRGYHSIALLLPDGRVLSSGGNTELNAEVFSPPYLFKGARPVVTSSPSSITWGESFSVDSPDATSITSVTLVRLSAVTHAFNMNQRFLRLAFLQKPGGLTVTAPSGAKIAPPGDYMLFVLNAAGVPSIARIVRLDVAAAPTPPAAPTNLSATAASSTQINLTWTDNASNESGFRIERSADAVTFTEIVVVGPNVTTYANTALSAATQYWYRVRAYNATGQSAYAGPASATTQSAPTAPAAPTNLSATAVSSSQINLAWTDNASNESGFRIERSADGVTFTESGVVESNVTTYASTSLSAATKYWYRVRAYNATGQSAYAGPASATTQPAAPTAPAAPTNLSATAVSSSQINLTWTDNASNESGFRIERSADGATFTEIGVVGSNVTTYASTSLSAATKYWYRVRAYNATGPSAYAGPASATTQSAKPSAPKNLIGTRQPGGITLTWTDTSSNETGFSIERSADGHAFSQIATVAQNVSTYVDTSPGTSKDVFYRVRAFNLAGYSAYSNKLKVRNH
jgi:Galactose oxidase-like, Early set domain/Fibronectin type III domain/Kelch motif